MLDEYPVDERDIPRVQISPQKLEEWREVGWAEVSRAVTQRNSWYFQFQEKTQEGYEQIADKDNLVAFARGVPDSQHKNVLIRSSLETTLEAIIYGLYSETTYDERCAFAHLYEDHFLDGGVLHVGKTRTHEDPFGFVGVKWVAFRSPAPAIVASRDFIYFSYSGTTRDANGQRVLFRMLRSMPMDGVDVRERKNNNLVRGKISYLYLYRENGSRTEVSVQALHSTAGSLPSWAVTKTISFSFGGILNLVTVAEAKILMLNGTASTQGASMLSSSSSSGGGSKSSSRSSNGSSCGVCFRRFRMMRSKRSCKGCHRFACKSCTVKLSFLDQYKERSDTGVLPLRFCLNCMVKARTERQEITAHMLRDDSVDIDDDFNALDISIYRETLKTKYLDVLSDDEDEEEIEIGDDILDDIDGIHDVEYVEEPVSVGSTASSRGKQQQFMSSRIKVKYEPNYSAGESFEGTSVMSSNPSLTSSNPSFASSSISSSSLSGSLPFTLSASQPHLSRQNSGSDFRPYHSSHGASRPGSGNGNQSASSSGLKKTASWTSQKSQEADDLEQTFRLRMMLFPNESEEEMRMNVMPSRRPQAPPTRLYG